MTLNKGCEDVIYDKCEELWQKCLDDPERAKFMSSWLREDTLDSWCHFRVKEQTLPLIHSDPEGTWLTIGDGRLGTDAHFLKQQGVKVHATDISDALLKVASEKGLIDEYSIQNAENLSFPNDSFDYVYCKESLHHFPRPYLALHEMLRVARKAVILQEPRDQVLEKFSILPAIKKLSGVDKHSFEPVGNYIYTLSERELEKFLLGMHYRYCAFSGLNVFYIKGIEFCPKRGGALKDRLMQFKYSSAILLLDALQYLGLIKSRLITAILFKEKPVDSTIASLKSAKFSLRTLPLNPYL